MAKSLALRFIRVILPKHREAEDLLKKQNEELTKINAELDRFVYSASHDLRAPLMSVKGLLNMIKVDTDKTKLDLVLKSYRE